MQDRDNVISVWTQRGSHILSLTSGRVSEDDPKNKYINNGGDRSTETLDATNDPNHTLNLRSQGRPASSLSPLVLPNTSDVLL